MSDAQKFWTFEEALQKVKLEASLDEEDPDETFVTFEEFIGYFNEGIDEAEREICTIDEDYFLTRDFLPMVEGVSEYSMPDNILADKLRKVRYNYVGTKYTVKRIPRKDKFEIQDRLNDDTTSSCLYMYDMRNDRPGQRRFVLFPPARETAMIPPIPGGTPIITRHYIRNANRIPMPGEFIFSENLITTSFDTVTGAITVDPEFPYVTGDVVNFSTISSAYVLPDGLAEDTNYYVVRLSATRIRLAGSLAAARLASTGLVTGDRIQETPTGLVNGANVTFTLSQAPYNDVEVQLYLDGVFLRQGLHYTIAGQVITMLAAPLAVPIPQVLDAIYYPAPEDGDATTRPTERQEVPAGVIDGANDTFQLAATPANAASVRIYVNGVLSTQGLHYDIDSRTITFLPGFIPALGQTLDAVYDTAVIFFYDVGSGFFKLKVSATRSRIMATVIDIPEFATFIMEWVKANCLFKEGDPRLSGTVAKLEQQRQQMNNTLTNREPDDEDEVGMDLSFYEEMN